jgi:hypothetical protein
VTEIDDCCGSVIVVCCCEKVVAEAEDSSGIRRKENVCRWKPLLSNGSEDMTVDTSVCVCVRTV